MPPLDLFRFNYDLQLMTKIILPTFFLFAFLFTHAINAQTVETGKNSLPNVKRIYVEDDTSALPVTEGLASYLQAELAKQGFVVSDRKENADAILFSEISAQVTLDGDSSNPTDKAIYYCRLLSPNGKLYWKTTVKFVLISDWEENNKFVAQKIVEKLSKDWQKLAKKRADKSRKVEQVIALKRLKLSSYHVACFRRSVNSAVRRI
jgi:hypothetical protein